MVLFLFGCGDVRPRVPTEDELAIQALGEALKAEKLEGTANFRLDLETVASVDKEKDKKEEAAPKTKEALRKSLNRSIAVKFIVVEESPKAIFTIETDEKSIKSDPLKIEMLDSEKRSIRINRIPWAHDKEGVPYIHADFAGRVLDEPTRIKGHFRIYYVNDDDSLLEGVDSETAQVTLKQ